jgi:hypothetical protein
MKRLLPMFVISLSMLFISCGSAPDQTKTADTTAAVTPAPEPVKPPFQPFNIMTVQHRVKNFDKWEQGYLGHDSMRQAYGITAWEIGRDLKDSNLVYVLDKISDPGKAKSFSTSPGLKDAMMKAGVLGKPGITYGAVVRQADSPVATLDRAIIAHHVKDYEAWLKVFDAEGPATRAGFGLVDRMLARNLDDSNMVYIVFAVTDMAKAKARGSSPELKKIMTDAGVDSPPTIRYYRLVK